MNTKSNSKAGIGRSGLLRLLAAAALLSGLVVVGANTPAGAAEMCTIDGYSGTQVITVTPNPATPGSEVTITGTGFGPPGSETILHIGPDTTITVVIDEDGSFTHVWQVPDDWPAGTLEVSASCQDATVSTTTLEIISAVAVTTTVPAATTPVASGTPPTQSGVLPKTGSQILPLMIGGAVLLIVGAGLVVLTIRRRSAADA